LVALGENEDRSAIDWAIEQLCQGHDSKHLRQLAGCTGTESSFEIGELINRTFRELGLVPPSREEAPTVYAQDLAREYVAGRCDRDTLLSELSRLCAITRDPVVVLFQHLQWALEELQTSPFSYQLGGVTMETFDSILEKEIEVLLARRLGESNHS
jgi:hypothetical protein